MRKSRYLVQPQYKFYNPEGIYFVSFATVFWIDVFIREVYFEKVTEVLEYCRKNRGMKIYGYCIMPSHIHLLFKAEQYDPAELIRDLKHFTATSLIRLIKISKKVARNGYFGCLNEQGNVVLKLLNTNSGNTTTNPSKFIQINFSTKS